MATAKKNQPVSKTSYGNAVVSAENIKRSLAARQYEKGITKILKSSGVKNPGLATGIWASGSARGGSRGYGVAGLLTGQGKPGQRKVSLVNVTKANAKEFAKKKLVSEGKRSGGR